MVQRAPWNGIHIFEYLSKLRDDAVDKIVMQKLVEDDPMGDTKDLKVGDYGRYKAFAQADVPQFINVTCVAFTTQDGARHPSFTATLVATPKRGGVINMLLDEAHLEWLLAATSCSEQFVDAIPSVNKYDKLPDLAQPNVKWRKRGELAPMLCTEYRLASGMWKNIVKRQ